MDHQDDLPLFTKQLEEAATLEDLARIKEQVTAHVQQVWTEQWMTAESLERFARFHRALFRQVLSLTVAELAAEGIEMPPVPFAFVQFGSGGRGELSLSSDQDHGLIYGSEGRATREPDPYFAQLFHLVSRRLERLGYPRCEGNVLAANPRWRLSLSELKERIDLWFDEDNWEHVRYLTILSDIDCLAGQEELVAEVRTHLFQRLGQFPEMLVRIWENARKKQIPLGWFGNILPGRYGSEAGAISVKQGIYLPFVKSVRIWALGERIASPSTVERMRALTGKQAWLPAYGERMTGLLCKILTLRNGCPQRFHMENPGYIKLNRLTRREVGELKEMLRQVKHLVKETERYVQGKMG